jgi:hypothetical protein
LPNPEQPSAEEHVWDALPVKAVVELLSGLPARWWIAGGRAIDLFVGRETRPHGDTDVLILRRDQLVIQQHLSDWDLHRATYPGLRPWRDGEYLQGRYRDIWCRSRPEAPWSLQIMLLDTEGEQWVFKQDPSIRGRLDEIGRRSSGGIPYLAPEIQLLHKAKRETLEKDQADFAVAVPLLSRPARQWLLEVLGRRFPEGHHWITALRELAHDTSRRERTEHGTG